MRKQRYRTNTRVYCENRKCGYYIKAALYITIVLLSILSIIFVKDAGESDIRNTNDKITYLTIEPLTDASGEEVPLEIPVINGGDITEVNLIYGHEAGISFDVLSKESASDTSKISVGTKGPQILIYHTHT